MPRSLARNLTQLVQRVFLTKNSEGTPTDEIRDEVHAYIGGIVANHESTLLKAGSIADPIRLLGARCDTIAGCLSTSGICGIDHVSP